MQLDRQQSRHMPQIERVRRHGRVMDKMPIVQLPFRPLAIHRWSGQTGRARK